MNQSRKRIVLGLIGLCCLGSATQVAAAPVTSSAELTANGGVVTTDATSTSGSSTVTGALGISNSGNTADFIYTGNVQINITGYDTALGGNKSGIVSGNSDMTLGKTTLIWRNDAANTEISSLVHGAFVVSGSTMTLGDDSVIDITANTSGNMMGLYAGNNSAGGPGNIVLGDRTTIKIENSNSAGQMQGIRSYDGSRVEAGDKLTIDVKSATTNSARAFEVGLANASISIGEDAKVTVTNTGGQVVGIFSYLDGEFTAGKNLDIRVNSDTAGATQSLGVAAMNTSKVYLNGAAIVASNNGVAGTGHSRYSTTGSLVQGNLGKYNLVGHMWANSGAISVDFDKGSYFMGYSRITGTGTADFTMDGTTWNMTGDSDVTSLTFSGDTSNIVFGGDSAYKTLTIGDLAGTGGNFTMRTDLVGDGAGNNAGDFLEVTGTSAGNHTVTVQNNGAANATGDETLTIIRTADGVAKFTNTNVVELGGYEYNLREVAGSNEKEWELFGTKAADPTTPIGPEASKPGSAAVNLFAGSYLLNYAETQTLMKRMGDLRDGKENGNVWGRIYGGKFHSDSDSFLKDFDLKYVGIQVGADKKFVREDGKGVAYLGGFFGYTKGDIDYGYGSGDVDSKSIGAYWTHMHHNGFYADAVLKYGWMKNDFDVLDSQGAKVTGDDISTRGFTGSLEVGRRYHFDQQEKSGWYVEPQAQLTVSQQNGDRFTASNGLNIKVDSFRSVMGRVGTHVGYEVKGGKNPINIYGKVSVVKEFDGDVNYSFNGSPESTSYKDTWVVYGVGATAKLGARHNLYLDVERATGGQFTQSWAINGGYRYSW